MKYLRFYYTSHDWEFGVGFSLPSMSKRFLFGTKMILYFSANLFIGPFTIEIGPMPQQLVREDWVDILEQTGILQD